MKKVKTFRDSSRNYAQSIHVACGPFQARETVLLKSLLCSRVRKDFGTFPFRFYCPETQILVIGM
jgi:hypothetical protein